MNIKIKGLANGIASVILTLGLTLVGSVARAELPTSVSLLAGKDIFVGFVDIENNNGILEVTYSVEGGWCLQHVHADAAADSSGIPQTRRGSPIPGRFQVNEAVACEATKTVTLGDVPSGNFVVAAHAVVASLTDDCQGEGVLYGTERGTGWIYEIDAVACSAEQLIDTGDPFPADSGVNSPNGLAYDSANNLLYFSVTDMDQAQFTTPEAAESQLWAADLDNDSVARVDVDGPGGSLDRHAASGEFFIGEYWYVENQSDRLKKVAFSGTHTGSEQSVCDIDGGEDLSSDYRFGDIVVVPGTTTLLGSTNGALTSTNSFFSLDLNNCSNLNTLCTDPGNTDGGVGQCADQQQLAYGSNGVLYGHPTGDGQLFVVDATTGLNTEIACNDIGSYTDLAAGPQCSPKPTGEDETAWGEGDRFVRRGNWATFININQ